MCLTIKISPDIHSDYRDNKLTVVEVFDKCKEIAEKDIICYKEVIRTKDKNIYLSRFRKFKYEIGMHYYQTGTKFIYEVEMFYGRLNISRGIHSWVKNPISKKFKSQLKKFHIDNYTILKCIIPKGSIYFKGIFGDYVSDNLIVVEEI